MKKEAKKKIPNPGSDAALLLNCRCPVLDNNHGKYGVYGKDCFWVNPKCPLHGGKNAKK